jgi:hypothetical protein
MSQYKQTGHAEPVRLDAAADAYYAAGEHAAVVGDKYICVAVAHSAMSLGATSDPPFCGVRMRESSR